MSTAREILRDLGFNTLREYIAAGRGGGGGTDTVTYVRSFDISLLQPDNTLDVITRTLDVSISSQDKEADNTNPTETVDINNENYTISR